MVPRRPHGLPHPATTQSFVDIAPTRGRAGRFARVRVIMRFLFRDAERVRRIAKNLRTELAGLGYDWPLSRCRQATAEACGYPDFHEAEASAGKSGSSEVDDLCTQDVVQERRSLQREALLRHGVAPSHVDALVVGVGFTRSRKAMASVNPLPEPHVPARTPRQDRILAYGGAGGSLRAANFESCILLDAHGAFVGLALGTDHSFEHDQAPDGLLEALGVLDGAQTIGQARVGNKDAAVRLMSDPRGGADDLATVLYLNRGADRLREDDLRLTRARFEGAPLEWKWRSVPRPGVNGFVAAWNFGSLALASFDPTWRDGVVLIAGAMAKGSLSMAFHRATGPILILADHLSPETAIADVVQAVRDARDGGGRATGRGHNEVVLSPALGAAAGNG